MLTLDALELTVAVLVIINLILGTFILGMVVEQRLSSN